MLQRNRGTPTPGVRLGIVGEVRVELAKIYRGAKRGELVWSDATKAAHILAVIARLIEGSAIEQRLADLEQRVGQQHPALPTLIHGQSLGRKRPMPSTSALARRLARLERLHGGAAEDAEWATYAEEQVLAKLRRENALAADVRDLAAEAIRMVAATRRAAGLPRPQVAHAGPRPEVLELMEAARRELQLDLVDSQR
jgi:hypothetical protein